MAKIKTVTTNFSEDVEQLALSYIICRKKNSVHKATVMKTQLAQRQTINVNQQNEIQKKQVLVYEIK